MTDPPSSEVTRLLMDWRDGDDQALEDLIPMVYDELRAVAQKHVSLEGSSTLQATELVNEAYLRLVGMDVAWQGRVHFFAVAAGLMRRILIDRARRRLARKRGGPERPVVLTDVGGAERPLDDLIALDEAMRRLERHDARKSRALELRYFGGLTVEETAEVMGLSRATVERDLKTAKAWVLSQVGGGKES